jgi:hypothetical protein
MMIKKTVFGLAVVTVIVITPYAGAALARDEARAAGFGYETENGTVTITGYTGKATDVAIPGGIDGLPVTAIGAGAFSGCAILETISVSSANRQYQDRDGVLFTQDGTTLHSYPAGNTRTAYAIPDGVTAIGEGAFWKCVGLASVTIPDGVTSIGENAFFDCDSLASVTIPGSVASIGENAFWYCAGLVSVTMLDGVTSIGEKAFWNCESLVSVTIPDSVTRIGEKAFWNCPLDRATRTDIERRFDSGQRTVTGQ